MTPTMTKSSSISDQKNLQNPKNILRKKQSQNSKKQVPMEKYISDQKEKNLDKSRFF